MSVSWCAKPYSFCKSAQVSCQLAQVSGMPTLLTRPSALALAISSSMLSAAAGGAEAAVVALALDSAVWLWPEQAAKAISGVAISK